MCIICDHLKFFIIYSSGRNIIFRRVIRMRSLTISESIVPVRHFSSLLNSKKNHSVYCNVLNWALCWAKCFCSIKYGNWGKQNSEVGWTTSKLSENECTCFRLIKSARRIIFVWNTNAYTIIIYYAFNVINNNLCEPKNPKFLNNVIVGQERLWA